MVVAIASVLLFIAVPALRDAFYYDSLNKAVSLIARKVGELKRDASREAVDYFLVFDLGRNAIFSFSRDMTAEKIDELRKKALALPEGVKIRDVFTLGRGEHVEGEVPIMFSAAGYAQVAVVHLTEGKRVVTVFLEPFLLEVRTVYDDVALTHFWENNP